VWLFFTSERNASSAGQQAYLKPSNTPLLFNQSPSFGSSAAISVDIAVIGSYNESSGDKQDSGAVYVFVRNDSEWTFQGYLKPPSLSEFDAFGLSVAVSGDTIVVGAPGNRTFGDPSDPDTGAAYVFSRSGTNWIQQAHLHASNTEAGDVFGWSVAISGNTIVIGAWGEGSNARGVNGNQNDNSAADSGAAYIFVRDGTNWSQQAYLKASNAGAGDLFGRTVAISHDTVVVGAYQEDSISSGVNGNQNDDSASDAGAAYVFVRSGTTWSQQAYLKASNTEFEDRFGVSVAISDDMVVVGGPSEDSNARVVNGNQANNAANAAGAAYVFKRNGTNWSQQAYLKASNADPGDYFGSAVAISGDTIIAGAPVEASNARGINGNQPNNEASFAGAAYVFVRSGTRWLQQAYLKASNTDPSDNFGASVAISGDTAVIGASQEASNATGVNGDQTDNSNFGAGAAYVFSGLGLGVFPDGADGYSVRFKDTSALTYRMERALTLSGPWTTIATNTATDLGIISVHDTDAPSKQGFYRTARP
jgi:hypothetical protein